MKSASELSSRPTLILAPLVLGVQFTFFGAEGNSSSIAALAQTTSRGPCLQVLFFLLSGNFLVEAALRFFLPEAQKGLDFFLNLFLFMFLFKELAEDMMHGAKILKIRCKILFQRGHMSVCDFETDI